MTLTLRFCIFALFISFQSFSQIEGTVTDSNDQPLAFVNIFIENTYKGTTSNEDGYYELNITNPDTYTVVFQYLGYKTVKKEVDISSFPFTLDATLIDEEISLNEVVINSEENPANIIIRKAIAQRDINLNKIKSYAADFYSRGLIRIKDAPETFMGQDMGDLGGGLDSTRSGVIYLSETISKLQFLRPNKLKEKIIASKVSGNDNGFSFNTAIDVEFELYDNTITLGNKIVSPIANNAFGYYRYQLEGVFYDDRGNLINKIKVTPRRENDPVFEGLIYIVEDQWTIYAAELDITGTQARIPAVDKITVTQNFSYSEKDAIWAKISQNIDFKYGIFGIKGDGRFTAVYSNYEFNLGLTRKDFNREIVSFEAEANKKDSLFWKTLRPVPLTEEEITDYIKKDSIQVVRESKTYKDSVDSVKNKWKLGDLLGGYTYNNSYEKWSAGISSPIEAISFNTVQGWNADIGVFYRKYYDEYQRYFSINGNINYGFSDDRLRGTVSATYKFNNISRPYLTVSGGVTTQQFNGSEPISKSFNTGFSLFSEQNFMKIYENSYVLASYSNELFNGFRINTSLSYQRRKALFNTTDQAWYPKADREYTSNNPLDETAYGIAPFATHNIMKLNLSAQINFAQNYLSHPDGKINVQSSKYPTLRIGYEKGFSSSVDGYDFDQIKFRLSQGLNVSSMGRFNYNLKAGKFFGGDDIAFVDYQHFNGNQTNFGQGTYLDVFNNLPYYALSTNDAYLEMHAEHDFNGFILGRVPLLKKLNFNLVLGAHALATPNTNPYQEYSVGLDNIGWGKFRFLRLDYVRSYLSGFQSDAIIFGLKFF
ncbi:MAG: carboxypeptidase-like regulatory domain-containing protein [Algicola sp.]|nr:carboxypeptidase-like regulatory domain-containing protein [Algicola sp.]